MKYTTRMVENIYNWNVQRELTFNMKTRLDWQLAKKEEEWHLIADP